MSRGPALLPAVLLVALLAGCIQVQVPAAPAAEPEPAQAGPADRYAVTCRLLDENGSAVLDGACDYAFGSLGAKVPVDSEGKAVRMVPTGATGTVTGTAPGRAAAKATLTIDGAKNVRMTLPRVKTHSYAAPAPASPANASAMPATANATVDANATRDVVYDPVLDVLLAETYAPPLQATYRFNVSRPYDQVEVVARYDLAYADAADYYAMDTQIRVSDPFGRTVVDYDQVDAFAVFYLGGSVVSFPVGLIDAPKPGTYTVTVKGLGTASGITVQANGLAGGAPDFPFRDVVNGTVGWLHDLKGKAVLLDLMATWCPPCQDSMPDLNAIQADYHGKVQVLSVDMDPAESADDLKGMREEYGATWRFGLDEEGLASDHYNTGLIPSYVVIDPHGRLVFRGVSSGPATLREMLDKALARAD